MREREREMFFKTEINERNVKIFYFVMFTFDYNRSIVEINNLVHSLYKRLF